MACQATSINRCIFLSWEGNHIRFYLLYLKCGCRMIVKNDIGGSAAELPMATI